MCLFQTVWNRKCVRQTFAYVGSFEHILFKLTSFIYIPNSLRMLYNTSVLCHRLSSSLYISDILFKYAPVFTPEFDKYRISDQ